MAWSVVGVAWEGSSGRGWQQARQPVVRLLQVGVHALPEGADGSPRVLLSLRVQQPDGGP